MHKKLLFIFFFIVFNLFGQEIDIDAESNYLFNKESEELLVFQNDSIFIYDINSFHLLEKKGIITPPNFNFKLHHILNKEPIHFVEFNGGKVYQLKNDSIQRVARRRAAAWLGVAFCSDAARTTERQRFLKIR